MNKQDALRIIKLLSALESLCFAVDEKMPDYLSDQILEAMEVLEKIVLGVGKP